jgi:hypothetical protein
MSSRPWGHSHDPRLLASAGVALVFIDDCTVLHCIALYYTVMYLLSFLYYIYKYINIYMLHITYYIYVYLYYIYIYCTCYPYQLL